VSGEFSHRLINTVEARGEATTHKNQAPEENQPTGLHGQASLPKGANNGSQAVYGRWRSNRRRQVGLDVWVLSSFPDCHLDIFDFQRDFLKIPVQFLARA
jgi:hypothetical protein